jgi:hypothetical protein
VQVSIATVITVEQAAFYLADGDANSVPGTADMFLTALATLEADGSARGGGAFACLRDTTCFLDVLADAADSNVTTAQGNAASTVTQSASQVASDPPAAAAPVGGFATGVCLPAFLYTYATIH